MSMSEKKNTVNNPGKVYLVSDTPPALRLRQAREAKGLTQTELAKKVHTLYQRIHEWESSWKVPSDKYYEKLAEALDVDPSWLKDGRMDKAPRYLYDSYSLDKEVITDEEYEFRNHLIASSAEYLSWMDYKTLFALSDLISSVLHADRIINDPQFQEGVKETVKKEGGFTSLEFAGDNLENIQKLLKLASKKVKE